ncbi:hypothetical protein DLJ53_33490 [Acuticoccus sediminis]|uniref:Uncharacterized protein n=1 Tax=Acuticoccus sediminis TaxID=2184697 RepID=A0A8B2NH43_9HYPH|nr:hypothetical protein [Acuticoccus sediminis]RAH96064.1 hypothetical protein DLJ53_33490 [Acuticoccus sediminis]
MQPIEVKTLLQGADFRQLADGFRAAAAHQRHQAATIAAEPVQDDSARQRAEIALRHAAMLEREARRYDLKASDLADATARLRLVTDKNGIPRDILIMRAGAAWPPARQEAP